MYIYYKKAIVEGAFLPIDGPSLTVKPAFIKLSRTTLAQEYVAKIADFFITFLIETKKSSVQSSEFFLGEKGSRNTASNFCEIVFIVWVASPIINLR